MVVVVVVVVVFVVVVVVALFSDAVVMRMINSHSINIYQV